VPGTRCGRCAWSPLRRIRRPVLPSTCPV